MERSLGGFDVVVWLADNEQDAGKKRSAACSPRVDVDIDGDCELGVDSGRLQLRDPEQTTREALQLHSRPWIVTGTTLVAAWSSSRLYPWRARWR